MDLEKLLGLISDTNYTYSIGYGYPRVETYSIDKDHYYGYDSSGTYRFEPTADIIPEHIQRVYREEVIFRR